MLWRLTTGLGPLQVSTQQFHCVHYLNKHIVCETLYAGLCNYTSVFVVGTIAFELWGIVLDNGVNVRRVVGRDELSSFIIGFTTSHLSNFYISIHLTELDSQSLPPFHHNTVFPYDCTWPHDRSGLRGNGSGFKPQRLGDGALRTAKSIITDYFWKF
jgi:hypothetical protein